MALRLSRTAARLALGTILWVSGTAAAQVTVGGPGVNAGDPTIDPLPLCDGHIIPTEPPPLWCECCLCGCLPGYDPPNLLGYLPFGYSWADATPDWHKDRRPAVIMQMGSQGWGPNPRSAPSFWWVDDDGDPNTLMADQWLDFKSPNPDLTSETETFGTRAAPQANGIPDQFDVLIRRIKRFGSHGFRRFIFHLPGGVLGVRQTGVSPPDANGNTYPIYGGSNQSMNQFLGMPSWKRGYFLNPNGAWMQFVQQYCSNTPDTEPDKYSIEVYIGGGLGYDGCLGIGTQPTLQNPDGSSNPFRVASFSGYEEGEPRFDFFWSEPFVFTDDPFPLNPYSESHTAAFWREIKPWTDCGVRTIWLDASSSNTTTNPRRWGALEISHNPYLRQQGIRIGGETIPTITYQTTPPTVVADDCALAVMKWLANGQVIFTGGCDGPRPRQIKPIYNFNRANSEVHVADNGNNCGGLDWNEWRATREHGFVVSMYFGKGMPQVELTKRWYSMGPITVADFNADGVVTPEDDAMAYAATHPTIAPAIVVFATGDINEDGAINEDDWTFWQLYRAGTNGPVRDYAGPNDM